MKKFSCEGCGHLINKSADGSELEFGTWYCAKFWNKGYELRDQKLVCRGRFHTNPKSDDKNEVQ